MLNSRASRAAAYPVELCDAILLSCARKMPKEVEESASVGEDPYEDSEEVVIPPKTAQTLRKGCVLEGGLADDLIHISEAHEDDEQHTPKAE